MLLKNTYALSPQKLPSVEGQEERKLTCSWEPGERYWQTTVTTLGTVENV